MSKVMRSALIARPVTQVFDLINEVEDYPRHFSWCRAAKVLARDEDGLLARMQMQYAGFHSEFTTRNRVLRPTLIELGLVEGPFSRLRGSWQLLALGENGCKVSLALDFEFAGRLVGSALALGFQGLADRMVDDFSTVARQLPLAAAALPDLVAQPPGWAPVNGHD